MNITEQRTTVFCGDQLKNGITTAELIRIDTRGWALVKAYGVTRWVPDALWARDKAVVVDQLKQQFAGKQQRLEAEVKTIERTIEYIEGLR